MRIKLTANSNVSLPAHLSNVNLSYGYTLHNYEEVDTWTVKVSEGIDKALSFFKPLSLEQKDFIQSVTESVKFLDSHIPESDSHLDNLKIQLNIKTPLNQGMLKVSTVINNIYMSIRNEIHNDLQKIIENGIFKLGTMTNPYLGHILEDKIMYLGSEIFNINSEFNSISYIKENLGMQQASNFLVYHESSHAFESTNTNMFGDKFSPLFSDIYNNTKSIAYNELLRNDLNNIINSNPDLKLKNVYDSYHNEIATLYKEIYADTGSILLQRNQDILEGKHSRENDLLNINTIIEGRNIEQQFLDQSSMSSNYPNKFDHFTSPGLNYLKDNCNTLPNKVLSQEEIHTIAHKAVEQGISRMLIATSVANKCNIDELTTLFSLKLETDGNGSQTFLIPSQINPHIYVDTMTELKKYAGEDWVNEFTNNIHLIHGKNMDDKKKSTWHAAFFPKKFKEDLANHESVKVQRDEIFGFNNQYESSLATAKIFSEIEKKETATLRVNNMLDKFRKPSTTNSHTNKPHSS